MKGEGLRARTEEDVLPKRFSHEAHVSSAAAIYIYIYINIYIYIYWTAGLQGNRLRLRDILGGLQLKLLLLALLRILRTATNVTIICRHVLAELRVCVYIYIYIYTPSRLCRLRLLPPELLLRCHQLQVLVLLTSHASQRANKASAHTQTQKVSSSSWSYIICFWRAATASPAAPPTPGRSRSPPAHGVLGLGFCVGYSGRLGQLGRRRRLLCGPGSCPGQFWVKGFQGFAPEVGAWDMRTADAACIVLRSSDDSALAASASALAASAKALWVATAACFRLSCEHGSSKF